MSLMYPTHCACTRPRRGKGSSAELSRRGRYANGKRTTPVATEGMMAKGLSDRQAVPLEDVAPSQSFQLEAVMDITERRDVVWKTEVLAEIKRLKANTPKAR